MGLYFSHGSAHWAYRYFKDFRRKLAKEINLDLETMEGYSDNDSAISWDTVKDPIVYLLNHSDCDGDLSPQICKVVATRLRELVQKWEPSDLDKQQALLLADGMELAFKRKELFVFC